MTTRGFWTLLALLLATVAYRSALAQGPTNPFPPFASVGGYQRNVPTPTAFGPGSHELQSITRRLEAIEAENARLRTESCQLRQMIAPPAYPVARASFTTGPVEHAGFSQQGDSCACGAPGCDHCSDCCPDCGKAVCGGIPHLCGVCLEDLGWNKAGGWRIVPFGMLRGEAIYAGQATTADAVIFFLNPTQQGVNDDSFTVHGKTSMLNFEITGPPIGSFQTGGMVVMNFLGPQPLRNTSGPNLLAAYGELKNDAVRFAFGRMPDLFGPIAPNTVNMGQQRGAGNVGIYRGAIHLDRYFTGSEVRKWTLSARIAQQTINDYLVVPQVRGKDNGWPNVEMRVGVELGESRDGIRPLELGVSGLIGETQAVADEALIEGIIFPALDDVSTTWGVCLDAQLQGKVFGARGEVWTGQAAGTYFMATLQSLNPDAQGDDIPNPIRSVGGWGEVYMKPRDGWTFYAGFGIDDPRNDDTGFVTVDNTVGQIRRNQVAWATVKWDVTDFFELALEISHRETHFINSDNASDTMLYHFSSSLKY